MALTPRGGGNVPRGPQVEDLVSGRRRVPPSATRVSSRLLSAGAIAVRAPWPAAGPTLAFLQLLLCPANAAFSGHLLLGILDPADELVAGQRCDVLPGIECRGVGDQRLAQVFWKLVHHTTGHLQAAHRATVASQGEPYHHPSGPDRKITDLLSHSEDLRPGMTRSRTCGMGAQWSSPNLGKRGSIDLSTGMVKVSPHLPEQTPLGKRQVRTTAPVERPGSIESAHVVQSFTPELRTASTSRVRR